MIVTMLEAKKDQLRARIFIGCPSHAATFAAWLLAQGWRVTDAQEVESEMVERTLDEVEAARALCFEFERHLAMLN